MSVKNQKLKLLRVKEILERETDSEHGIQMDRILDLLAMWGIFAERKSIYTDIETLQNNLGMDISRPSGSDKEYKLLSREFEVSELRLIIDAIQADRFLSEQTCDRLIHKIESLCSKWEANALQQSVIVSGRVKGQSDGLTNNIEWVHTAIRDNRQIMFRYFDWGVDGKRKYRECPGGGNVYVVSPYHLIYENSRYYLLAYQTYAQRNARLYRLDKMTNICVLKAERDGREEMEKINPVSYTTSAFGMFCGEAEPVMMRFENGMAGVVVDRFGHDVIMVRDGEEHFTVSLRVVVSDQFFGWVFGLGGKAEIVGPGKVLERWRERIGKVYERYK